MSCQPSRVVIQKRAARTQRFRQQFAAVRPAVVLKVNSRRDVTSTKRKPIGPAVHAGTAAHPPGISPRRQLQHRKRSLTEIPGASWQSDQAIADRVHHQLRRLVDSQRIHDVRAMHRQPYSRSDSAPLAISLFDFPATICCRISSSRSVSRIAFALQCSGPPICGSNTILPSATCLDGADQVQIHRIFQHVAARARLHRLPDQSVFGVHAQHQNRRSPDFLRRICRVASMPLNRGSAQSITITFGRSSSARDSTASMPSLASPTTCNRRFVLQHPPESLAAPTRGRPPATPSILFAMRLRLLPRYSQSHHRAVPLSACTQFQCPPPKPLRPIVPHAPACHQPDSRLPSPAQSFSVIFHLQFQLLPAKLATGPTLPWLPECRLTLFSASCSTR